METHTRAVPSSVHHVGDARCGMLHPMSTTLAVIDEDISQNRLPTPPHSDVYTDEQTDSEREPHQIWWENHTSPRASTWTPIQRFPSVTYHRPLETSVENTDMEEYVPDLSVD